MGVLHFDEKELASFAQKEVEDFWFDGGRKLAIAHYGFSHGAYEYAPIIMTFDPDGNPVFQHPRERKDSALLICEQSGFGSSGFYFWASHPGEVVVEAIFYPNEGVEPELIISSTHQIKEEWVEAIAEKKGWPYKNEVIKLTLNHKGIELLDAEQFKSVFGAMPTKGLSKGCIEIEVVYDEQSLLDNSTTTYTMLCGVQDAINEHIKDGLLTCENPYVEVGSYKVLMP